MTLKDLSQLGEAHIHISREATTRENEIILDAWALNVEKFAVNRARMGLETNVLAVCHNIADLWHGARGEYLYRILRDRPEVRHALSVSQCRKG